MKLILTLILFLSASMANADKIYSKPYIKMLVVENARNSIYVTPALALAVAKVESNFRVNVVSSMGAIGVMQIMPRTALLEFGVKRKDLFNPKINISLGVKFLDSLIKKYRGNIGIALSHYNGGSAVGKWPKVKIIPATYPYVEKVLKNSYKLGNNTPSLLKIRNIRTNKTNVKLDKKYIFSEIDLLLNNIDKWLNIYNGHQKSIVKDIKYVLSNKQVIFQGKGTNAQAFY